MMTFEDLRVLVEFSTGERASKFYKRLYGRTESDGPLHIRSWDEWRSLPTFTKDHLLAAPMPERAFSPWSNIDSILVSSGTSGKPPVYSPFTMSDGYVDARRQYHDFKGVCLASIPPATKKEWELSHINPAARVITLDPKRGDACITLAEAAGIDSMIVATFHIPLVGDALAARGLAKQIKYIEIAGEPCSRALYQYVRTTFPNAVLVSEYGSTDVETSPIGILCHPIDGTEPLEVFHAGPRTYLEIIDPMTGAAIDPVAGAEGSLLISAFAGDTATFPLIRYRIGDSVRVVESACAKHGTWSFAVLGRTELDFIKIPGGLLRADEVERVLRSYDKDTSDRFELHCRDTDQGGAPKIEIVLYVNASAYTDLQALAAYIEEHMRVAPTFSYKDGVDRGLYLPLRCEPLDTVASGKRRRMIRHE